MAHLSDYTPNYDLKYAYQDASGWNVEVVDAEGSVGHYTSLALDGMGYPHISYVLSSSDDLRYAYKDASGWHIEVPDSDGNIAHYTSLVLDGEGFAHISCRDNTNTALKHAYEDAQGWHTEIVDQDGNAGIFNSFSMDGQGNFHIGYQDNAPNLDLKYARATTPTTIDLTGSLTEGQLVLTWTGVAEAAGYWVYGKSNVPWFLPGMAPGHECRIEIALPPTTTWSSPNGIGDPDSNWTYLIMAVDAAESELGRSNRFGEFDFEGDIP